MHAHTHTRYTQSAYTQHTACTCVQALTKTITVHPHVALSTPVYDARSNVCWYAGCICDQPQFNCTYVYGMDCVLCCVIFVSPPDFQLESRPADPDGKVKGWMCVRPFCSIYKCRSSSREKRIDPGQFCVGATIAVYLRNIATVA